jgi:hypothetical protein
VEFVATRAEAFEVLLVEDSPGDVRLTREAFRCVPLTRGHVAFCRRGT